MPIASLFGRQRHDGEIRAAQRRRRSRKSWLNVDPASSILPDIIQSRIDPRVFHHALIHGDAVATRKLLSCLKQARVDGSGDGIALDRL